MPNDFSNPAVASHTESSKAGTGLRTAATYERPSTNTGRKTDHGQSQAPLSASDHLALRTPAKTQGNVSESPDAQRASIQQHPPSKRRLDDVDDESGEASTAPKRLRQEIKPPSEVSETPGERGAASSGRQTNLPAVSVTQRVVPAGQAAPPASRSAIQAPNVQARRPPKAASSALFVPKKKVLSLSVF